MKKKTIATALMILFFIGAFFYYFRGSPQYSLLKIAQAYKNHDIELAEKHIDIDSLATQISETFITAVKKAMFEESEPKDEWESLGLTFARGITEMMEPMFKEKLKEVVKEGFKKSFEGQIPDKIEELEIEPSDFKSFTLRDLLPNGRIKVKRDKKVAYVTFIKFPDDKDFVFKMRRIKGRKWQIVSFENLEELLESSEGSVKGATKMLEELDSSSGDTFQKESKDNPDSVNFIASLPQSTPILTSIPTPTPIPISTPTPTSELVCQPEPTEELIKPTACFEISSDFHYKDNEYYSGTTITFDGSCSENVASFFWYCDNSLAASSPPQSIGIVFKLPFPGCNQPTTEITLLTTSSDDLTDSFSKTIKLRPIPLPTVCFHPLSSERKIINFNEEVVFDASCSEYSEENPITKFVWKFRDGDLEDYITKEGAVVKHAFTKFAKNFWGWGCYFGRGFEVELDIETKLGGGGGWIHHYCPDENDEVLDELRACMKGEKNIDECIEELDY